VVTDGCVSGERKFPPLPLRSHALVSRPKYLPVFQPAVPSEKTPDDNSDLVFKLSRPT